jgi:hypothetical protein
VLIQGLALLRVFNQTAGTDDVYHRQRRQNGWNVHRNCRFPDYRDNLLREEIRIPHSELRNAPCRSLVKVFRIHLFEFKFHDFSPFREIHSEECVGVFWGGHKENSGYCQENIARMAGDRLLKMELSILPGIIYDHLNRGLGGQKKGDLRRPPFP